MKKLVGVVATIAFMPILIVVLALLAILGLLLVLLDNYNLCTLPFELECQAPNSVYMEDVISEKELTVLSQDMVKIRTNFKEDLMKLPNSRYEPELFVTLPYLDIESIDERNRIKGHEPDDGEEEEVELPDSGWGRYGGTNSSSGGSYNPYNGKRAPYDKYINAAAEKYNVDPELIALVIHYESSWNPNTVSHAGAQGLMQLMPGTARYLGVSNPFDPEQNIMGGTKYIAELIRMFDGNVEYALYAYNAGPGNVKKWISTGEINNIPFSETRNYQPALKYKDVVQGGKLDPDKMKKALNDTKLLKNTYKHFDAAAKKYDINLGLLISVAVSGVSDGKSLLIKKYNNIGYNMCKGPQDATDKMRKEFGIIGCQQESNKKYYFVFDTKEDSINYLAYRLRTNYFDKGINSIREIARSGEEDAFREARKLDNNHKIISLENRLKELLIEFGLRKSDLAMDNRLVPGQRHKLKPDFSIYKGMMEAVYNSSGQKIGEKAGLITEAEMHLRTLLQNDASGTLGLDYDQLEMDLMLKKMYHKIVNEERDDGSFKPFNDLTPFTPEDVHKSKKQFYDIIINSELNEKEELRLRLDSAEKLTHDNYANTGDVLRLNASLQIYYPFLIVLYGKEPDHITIENVEEMKKLIKRKYKEREEEIEEMSLELSLLSIGRNLQSQGLREYLDKYKWLSPYEDNIRIRKLYDYIRYQKHRGIVYQKEDGTIDRKGIKLDAEKNFNAGDNLVHRVINSLISDMNVTNVTDFFKSLYIDNMVKNNDGVRALLYQETQEVMEIGSFVKARCMYVEKYGYEKNSWFKKKPDFCIEMNKQTFGDGIFLWETSETLTKTETEGKLSSYRISRIPEFQAKLREMEEKLEVMEEEYKVQEKEFKNEEKKYQKLESELKSLEHKTKAEEDTLKRMQLILAILKGEAEGYDSPENVPKEVIKAYEDRVLAQYMVTMKYRMDRDNQRSIVNKEKANLDKSRDKLEKARKRLEKERQKVEDYRQEVKRLENLKRSLDQQRASALNQSLKKAEKIRDRVMPQVLGVTGEEFYVNLKKRGYNFEKHRARDTYKGIKFHEVSQSGSKQVVGTDLQALLNSVQKGDADFLEKESAQRSFRAMLHKYYYKKLEEHFNKQSYSKQFISELQDLANSISLYTGKSYNDSLMKAYLISLNEFNVALLDGRGTVVGYMTKPNVREILDGTVELRIRDYTINSEIILKFEEIKSYNSEVEKLGFASSSMINPYYVTPYDIFKETKNTSLYTVQLERANYYAEFEKETTFDDEAFTQFMAIINADYSLNDKFKNDLRKYLIYGNLHLSSSGEFIGGAGSYVDGGVFSGVKLSLPLEINEGERLIVTSRFGPRWGRTHGGIDMIGPNGRITNVLSVAEGVVVRTVEGCVVGDSGCGAGWGNYVAIEHQGDTGKFYTLYAHLETNTVAVNVGDKVNNGTVLGRMGNTGNSFGAHLHFEVHQYQFGPQYRVDPEQVLTLNETNSFFR